MGPRHLNPVTFFDGKGPDNRPVAIRLADAEFAQKAPELKEPAGTLPKTTDHQAPPSATPEVIESGRDQSSVVTHPSQLPPLTAEALAELEREAREQEEHGTLGFIPDA